MYRAHALLYTCGMVNPLRSVHTQLVPHDQEISLQESSSTIKTNFPALGAEAPQSHLRKAE